MYTKGKWFTDNSTDKEGMVLSEELKKNEDNTYDHDKALNYGCLAQCYQDFYNGKVLPHKEMLANAKLMAAAPDLLEALQYIVKTADSGSMGIDFAEEAIKKAIG